MLLNEHASKPFIMDTFTQTEIHRQTKTHRNRFNGELSAGTDSNSYNRKTENAKYRKDEVENSNLGFLLGSMTLRGSTFISFHNGWLCIICNSEYITKCSKHLYTRGIFGNTVIWSGLYFNRYFELHYRKKEKNLKILEKDIKPRVRVVYLIYLQLICILV